MEKAKAFFLICAGLFMLTMSVRNGNESALADVNPTGVIHGHFIFDDYQWPYVLMESGEVYRYIDGDWHVLEDYAVPVPVEQITMWTPWSFVSVSGDVWLKGSDDDEWENIGTPDEPVPAPSSDWSQLKSNFGK